ncbi:hypothetical protein Q4525_20470 [Shimia thalassica]|uniref:hypothetical protein n=1 Tax=Shimia thalassica TaxID=1715693 RepID=UPI001C0A4E8A|nr:hypothetical protein [Shimia thalassica]MBU2944312.1 hypothetical protein [Shimia thalassica]MDO6505318.1 hypothetical protein [Shimia thalassica]
MNEIQRCVRRAEQHFPIDGVQINGFAETGLASGVTAFYNRDSLWIIPEGAEDPGSSLFLEDFAFGGGTGGWIDVQMRALKDGGFVLAGAISLNTLGPTLRNTNFPLLFRPKVSDIPHRNDSKEIKGL